MNYFPVFFRFHVIRNLLSQMSFPKKFFKGNPFSGNPDAEEFAHILTHSFLLFDFVYAYALHGWLIEI